ncbi:MAG: hypothetical protein HYZ53_07025 [Planctomycetes bacterium]|nr:hypothetical protein [Planctomycetota bacterium]
MRDGISRAWLFPTEQAAVEAETVYREARTPDTQHKPARKLAGLLRELTVDGFAIGTPARTGRVVRLDYSMHDDCGPGPRPGPRDAEKEILRIAFRLKAQEYKEGDLEREEGRARLAALAPSGVRGFVLRNPLKGAPLLEDPGQKAEWTTALEVPKGARLELEGVFAIAFGAETRRFPGVIAERLLRLREAPGDSPRWRVGDVVVLVEERDQGLLARLRGLWAALPAAPVVAPEPDPEPAACAAACHPVAAPPSPLAPPEDTRWLPRPYDPETSAPDPAARQAADTALAAFIDAARGAGLFAGIDDAALRRRIWTRTPSFSSATGVDDPEVLMMMALGLDRRVVSEPEGLSRGKDRNEGLVRAAIQHLGLADVRVSADYVMGTGWRLDVVAGDRVHAVNMPTCGGGIDGRMLADLNAMAAALGRPADFCSVSLGPLGGMRLAVLTPEDRRAFKAAGITVRLGRGAPGSRSTRAAEA